MSRGPLLVLLLLLAGTPSLRAWESDRGVSFDLPPGWVANSAGVTVNFANSDASMGRNQLEGDDLFGHIFINPSQGDDLEALARARKRYPRDRVYRLGSGFALEGSNEEFSGMRIFLPVAEGWRAEVFAHSRREVWPRYQPLIIQLARTLSYRHTPPPPPPTYRFQGLSFTYPRHKQVQASGGVVSLFSAEAPESPIWGNLKLGESLIRFTFRSGSLEVGKAEIKERYPHFRLFDIYEAADSSWVHLVGVCEGEKWSLYLAQLEPNKLLLVETAVRSDDMLTDGFYPIIKASLRYQDKKVFTAPRF